MRFRNGWQIFTQTKNLIFKENSLFVFSQILVDERMLQEALATAKELMEEKTNKFEKVFICVPSWSYILDMNSMRFFEYEVSEREEMVADILARKMINE